MPDRGEGVWGDGWTDSVIKTLPFDQTSDIFEIDAASGAAASDGSR
jgi:hypothetical protein